MHAHRRSTANRAESRQISLWSPLHAVSFFRRSPIAVSALLGVALFVPGCMLDADECLEGDARCDDGHAQICTSFEHGAGRVAKWSSTDCGARVCVAGNDASGRPEAFCALSSQPDVRCVEPEGASCDGNALVECHSGRATQISACATACVTLDDFPDYCRENPPEKVHCVSGDGCELASPGFSAMSGFAPGAVCSGSEFGPAADPNTKVYSYSCESGLLARRERCASACVSTAACTTHCGS